MFAVKTIKMSSKPHNIGSIDEKYMSVSGQNNKDAPIFLILAKSRHQIWLAY